MYRNTPATICQCPFCLFNKNLPATERFKQFFDTTYWKTHIEAHILDLEKIYGKDHDKGKAIIPCPDERCSLHADSVNILLYHLQDAHCIYFFKITRPRRDQRCRTGKADLKSYSLLNDEKVELKMVNETTATLSSRCAKPPPLGSKPKITRKPRQLGKHHNGLVEPLHAVRSGEVIREIKGSRLEKHQRGPAQLSTISTDKIVQERRPGRPRKCHYSSPEVPTLPTRTANEGVEKRTRGRPKTYLSSSTVPLFDDLPENLRVNPTGGNQGTCYSSSIKRKAPQLQQVSCELSVAQSSQCKRGLKRKRDRASAQYSASSSGSPSHTTLSSTDFQRDHNDETTSLSSWSASTHHDASLDMESKNEAGSESDSDYELVNSDTHGSYWVSRKRRGKKATTSA